MRPFADPNDRYSYEDWMNEMGADEGLPELPPMGHPLQKLGARLGELLDEDHWAECERLLLEGWEHDAADRATGARWRANSSLVEWFPYTHEELARLRETLQGIADADWRRWEELATPDEFVRWAKSRAAHALRPNTPETGNPASAQSGLTDAYAGAREDLSIWKRRALEAERDLRSEKQTTSRLVGELNAANGPAYMGEPAASPAYGATEYGWADYRRLEDGDKRLIALVVGLYGNDHQSSSDLDSLLDRASHGQAPADAKALAEADRRAGEAERLLATCKEDVMRFEQVRSRMKYQWGADQRVSFDEVWDEALALKKAARADSVLEDASRLDWLLLHISGAEFRRIGVRYSGNARRADVDAARKQGANHDNT